MKYEIGNRKCTRQGFTIVELLVAMSLLVMLLGLSGMVFKTTVAAHRAAGATIDVSRNLRAITEQLNADFRGLRTDAPVFIAFNAFDTDGDSILDSHYDTIHFFADGDFQTGRQYTYWRDSNNDGVLDINDRKKTIHANISRVYYGHANSVKAINAGTIDYVDLGVLSRKSHLLTADSSIIFEFGEIPPITNTGIIDYTPFDDLVSGFGASISSNNYPDENELEFNTITLTNWINALNHLDAGAPDNGNHFIANCMADASRPFVDLTDINTLHLLLSQGILQMQIQWAYTNDDLINPGTGLPPVPGFTGVRWWPDVDPLGDGNDPGNDGDSDFGNAGMNRNQFGVYFTLPNLPIWSLGPDWFAVQNSRTLGFPFKDTFYPKALKFTFVLRDSNGVFADGKTFTHIVYLDN